MGLSSLSTHCVVLEYKTPSGDMVKLKAPIEGVVTFDRAAKKGAEMVQVSWSIWAATCIFKRNSILSRKDGLAGQRKEAATANVSMIHHVPELIVSNDCAELQLAEELGSADLKNVLNSRKLVLLVDLDQTVIHTTNRPFKIDPKVHGDIFSYTMFGTEYHTKLRPYTHEFLEHMSTLYEMHIITYGQRQYAHKIAEILDPKKTLFAQRILSRDELFSAQHKTRNLKALFPCGDQLIAIIDDRADVWQFSEALIQVKPYRFFKEVGDINAPMGVTKERVLPVAIEEDAENDGTLEHVERMLTDVHTNFYKHYDSTKEIRDVKIVISYLKKQVLRGLVIVLSGVVPLGMKVEHSEAYRLCVQFGATASYQKVMAACKLGVPIVTPLWLFTCVEKMLKVDAKEFELTKDSKPPEGRPLGGKIIPELTSIDAMKKETIAAMEHEVCFLKPLSCPSVDEVLSEGDDSDDEGDEEKLKRRLNGGDGSGDEDDEVEKELAQKRARWERESNFETPEEAAEDDEDMADDDDSFREAVYDDTSNGEEGKEEPEAEVDEDETRDIPYDEAEDEEIEDMAALIERQVSHES
ncbi:unnamed protein product [Heligmosomoides polygyrus]|uniref:RNA polymerase II subunit A C-terminal domain phosphatase n=1 Tax=Heligmosomoides polygyrus TaxID=6339 RepID=A0A3P8AI32_HELPZ|nr:unnamed protein product [Heligmosomoides polygyrus]